MVFLLLFMIDHNEVKAKTDFVYHNYDTQKRCNFFQTTKDKDKSYTIKSLIMISDILEKYNHLCIKHHEETIFMVLDIL